jgi:glucokinase
MQTQPSKVAVGIDIGGTNTVWGFIDEDGNVLTEDQFRTKKYSDPVNFVLELATKIKATQKAHPEFELIGIGIGAPNGNYFKGTIEYPPNLIWEGITPIKKMFQAHFELPIWLTNDANAAAIGEMQFGIAKNMKDFILVTLGTGLGSGFIANGELVYGHDGFAGELGHTIIEIGGRTCGCGRQGCLETYASATGIVNSAILMLKDYEGTSLLSDLQRITSKGIAKCAAKGDELALQVFDFTGHQLGFALANAVAISSPEAIIFFGGLANAGSLIIEPTQKYMVKYMLNLFQNKVKLLQSTTPEHHAAVLGSAGLVWKNVIS